MAPRDLSDRPLARESGPEEVGDKLGFFDVCAQEAFERLRSAFPLLAERSAVLVWGGRGFTRGCAAQGLCCGSLPRQAWGGREGVRAGHKSPARAAAVRPRMGVCILPLKAPLEVGTTVGALARHYGFWSLNPARIAYFVEETGAVERFGFGYGTLLGHAECGEERFNSSGAAKTSRSTTTSSHSPDRNTP